MFSRYKKTDAKPAPAPAAPAADKAKPVPEKPVSMRRAQPNAVAAPVAGDKEKKRKERLGEIKLELHRALLDNLNLAALDQASEADLRAEIQAIAVESLQEKSIVLNREERQQLNQELYDEVKGLGPLEALLKDDTVSDILVNGPQQIFVERGGKLTLSDITFKDERHLMRIIDKIVSAVGRRVDESNPYVSTRWCRRLPSTAASSRSGNSRRTSSASTTWCPSAPSPRRWRSIFRPPWPHAST